MKYIMVTDFDNHWDEIEGNFTSYSSNMIKSGMTNKNLVSGTPTLFIKRTKYSTEVKKAWSGKVLDVNNLSGKNFFRVDIEKEIECPAEYVLMDNGWYIESD